MPTYDYLDTVTNETFELIQSIKDEPLRVSPHTGNPVRRLISGGVSITRGHKTQLSDSNLAKNGFTKYKRDEKGHYTRVAGAQGPKELKL